MLSKTTVLQDKEVDELLEYRACHLQQSFEKDMQLAKYGNFICSDNLTIPERDIYLMQLQKINKDEKEYHEKLEANK